MNQREIIFRAWNAENNKMLILNLYQCTHYDEDFVLRENNDESWIDDTCVDVEWPIMQFTNRYDQNGNKVFEGDIIKDNDCNIYEVYWHDKYQWSKRMPLNKQFCGSSFSSDDIVPQLMKYTVIGNIYQNPELIK